MRQAKRRDAKIRLKAAEATFFGRFSNSGKCRSEVAGDVISGRNIKTVERYVVLHFEAASFSRFRANQNQPFV